MDFQALLKDKKVLYGVIAAAVIVVALALVLIITSVSSGGGKSKGKVKPVDEVVIKETLDLFTTEKIGQALEVQALLAREGIKVYRRQDGMKSVMFLKEYTMSQRDRALLAIVKSGLIDEHTGLEIFDKGDFTSTKEDKKIRLARAINGELARLIRKIPPIENAQVFISIPEQSMFATQQKPITATVQLVVPAGESLDNMKIKAITNLLLGAVHNLKSENIAITDTNGNTYNSIIDASNDALAKLQENDRYMQAKVAAQLDRLVGKGNYVVTVSTFLTQAPIEKSSIIYDPNSKTSVSEQDFSEKMGDTASDSRNGSPVSTYLPYGTVGTPGGGASHQDKSYTRSASETQYGVSKTHINEYQKAGVIEEISIAVSIEHAKIPSSVSYEDLKELIAHAASPKVNPENVSIAFIDPDPDILAPDEINKLPKPEESGNPWWVVGLVLLAGLGFGLNHIGKKVRMETRKQEEEMYLLREKAEAQDKQLQDVSSKATELIQRQAQMAQNLIEQQRMQNLQIQQIQQQNTVLQQQQYTAQNPIESKNSAESLFENLDELSLDFEDIDEDEAVQKLQSWIDN